MRDIVKAYYDKKTKKLDGAVTAENKDNKQPSLTPAAAIQPGLPARRAAAREAQSAQATSEDPR